MNNMILIVFVVILFIGAALVFPATKGVRQLYVESKKDDSKIVTSNLLQIMGMAFTYIIFQSVFWTFFFTARFYLPLEVIRSTTYAISLLLVASSGLLVPAIYINRWWVGYNKLIKKLQQEKPDIVES